MLGDFLGKVFEFVDFLWPLHIVHPWDRSIRVTCGRWFTEKGPGIYFKLPWFMSFHDCTIVTDAVTISRIDVPLKDGRMLSFQASALYRVADATKAMT